MPSICVLSYLGALFGASSSLLVSTSTVHHLFANLSSRCNGKRQVRRRSKLCSESSAKTYCSSHSKHSSSSKKHRDAKKGKKHEVSQWTQQYIMDPQTHELVPLGYPSGRSDGHDIVDDWNKTWDAAKQK